MTVNFICDRTGKVILRKEELIILHRDEYDSLLKLNVELFEKFKAKYSTNAFIAVYNAEHQIAFEHNLHAIVDDYLYRVQGKIEHNTNYEE
jgi:hypothetical protein